MTSSTRSNRWLYLAIVSVVLLAAVHTYVYWVQPLPEPWNDVVLNVVMVVAAGLAALFSMIVWQQFRVADPPRKVWRYFSLALWTWCVAEVIWTAYALTGLDVSGISPADALWLAGYVFFGAALVVQFRLVMGPGYAQRRWVASIFILALLLVTGLITFVMHRVASTEEPWWDTLLAVWYPVGDLGLALGAAFMIRAFGRGMWARPWIGLAVFVIADGLYTWLDFAGLYSVSSASGTLFTLLADTLYVLAYLVLGLGCVAQLLLLHYGPGRRHKAALSS